MSNEPSLSGLSQVFSIEGFHRGVSAPLPGFIEPALASNVERVPEGGRWIH
jgi:hypothetical protein